MAEAGASLAFRVHSLCATVLDKGHLLLKRINPGNLVAKEVLTLGKLHFVET